MEDFQLVVREMMKQQQDFMCAILEKVGAGQQPKSPEQIIDTLANTMTEFEYDAENHLTFGAWYIRNEDILKIDGKSLTDDARVRLLLRKLSALTYERYSDSILPKHPRDISFEETVKVLKILFDRTESVFSLRYKCLQTSKQPDEDYVKYASRVNKTCENFSLTTLTVNHFKALVYIIGLNSSRDCEVRNRLLVKLETEHPDKVNLELLTLESNRIVNLRTDSAMVENSTKPEVNFVQKNKKTHQPFQRQNKDNLAKKQPKSPCWQCGGMHYRDKCEFNGHKCSECGKLNHKEGYCGCNTKTSSTTGQNKSFKKPFVNRPFHSKAVYGVNQLDHHSSRKFVALQINGIPLKLQLDTGSDITIISEEMWHKLGSPAATKSPHQAQDASKNPINLLAEFECNIKIKDKSRIGTCFVSNLCTLNILGIDWMDIFKLWDEPISSICAQVQHPERKMELIKALEQKFPEVFSNELGHCTKFKVQLYLKEGSKPVYRPKRPVAYSQLNAIEEELQRLITANIITPIEYSDYAAPIVSPIKPNGKVRICGDYSTGLNDSLEPHPYPLPTPDEIFVKIAHGKKFAVVDLSDAYLQTEVSEEAKKLLTINTHRGLYQFNRLPPGVKAAPGAFQEIMDKMLIGMDSVAVYIDDIICAAEDDEKLFQILISVFARLEEFGFKVKREKCTFFAEEVKYLGRLISKDGIKPDPMKIRAIVEMPAPKNRHELASLLGSINYYVKFVPSMRNIRAPLDFLMRKDAVWDWSEKCEHAFQEFKVILSSDLLLTHYNPSLPIVVAGDASKVGIGAIIYHEFPDGSMKAISHVSRALTSAEENYSQVEKEGLALIFAVKKFHRYIFGRKFALKTDHKPLLSIFGSKKGIPLHTANRLKRWALILMMYDFDISYISTREFGHADVLSRLINQRKGEEKEYIVASIEFEKEVQIVVDQAAAGLPIKFHMLQEATKNCTTLQKVMEFVQGDWPASRKMIKDAEVAEFFSRKESLTVINSVLVFLDRIIIPKVFRGKILKEIHKGHPGMERMKSIARSYVYWPNLDKEIESFVKKCTACTLAAKSPTKTTLQSWPIPSKPWERLHIDYAGPVNGKYFLVAIDALSKWPEIFITTSMTATVTIEKLEEAFARFGIPDVIVSDNGTQFTSDQFKLFCSSNGIEHIRTSPFHPQSNGQAERFVDTLKRSLKKFEGEVINIYQKLQLFLSSYRSTPNKNAPEGKSPSEILTGRKMKTTLDLIKPPNRRPLLHNQKMEQQFNRRHGAVERSFTPGELVLAKVYQHNKSSWMPGKIIEKIGSVNYNVYLDVGKLIRSHTNQLIRRVEEGEFRTTDEVRNQPMVELFTAFDLSTTDEVDSGSVNRRSVPFIAAAEQQEAIEMEPEPNRARPMRTRQPPARYDPYKDHIEAKRGRC